LVTEIAELSTRVFPQSIIQDSPKRRRVLITGACGFFGHHLIEHLVLNTDWDIVALARMGKVGSLHRLMQGRVKEAWEDGRVSVVWHDLRSPVSPNTAYRIGTVDYVVHAAAETHVDRSIDSPGEFVVSNVLGTYHMLEFARRYLLGNLVWFAYFSTDEVYGPAPPGVFHDETYPYNATNPYAATKAGAEQLVNAYGNTYGLPVFITNTMNLFGERQHPEKFIPLIINNILDNRITYIHASPDGMTPGSRHYLHCRNAAAALLFLLQSPLVRQRGRYNIVGDVEVNNLTMVRQVDRFVHEWYQEKNSGHTPPPAAYELVDFHSSRPGHDLRYALDGSKLRRMGFSYPVDFETSLRKTVRWMLDHPEWLK